MSVKTVTCLAFAAACLTSFAANPGAHAQTMGTTAAPNYYGSQNWSGGGYGSTSEAYSPQSDQGGTYANPGGTEVVTNGPQGSPPPDWSAQRNVRESERYDRLLESNRAFREARMRRECGPITDPQLHQQCLSSFGQYEPYAGTAPAYGPSGASQGSRSYYGR